MRPEGLVLFVKAFREGDRPVLSRTGLLRVDPQKSLLRSSVRPRTSEARLLSILLKQLRILELNLMGTVTNTPLFFVNKKTIKKPLYNPIFCVIIVLAPLYVETPMIIDMKRKYRRGNGGLRRTL